MAKGARGIDPTKNVLKLVKEANRRQDDLRASNQRQDRIAHAYVKEIVSDQIKHVKELLKRDSKYTKAVRRIDTQASKSESERAQRAIDALATITASNATAVQKALTDTAITISKQTADTFLQVTDRLAALEKTSNLAAGQSAVSDPALVALAKDVRSLIVDGGIGVGRSEGFKLSTAAIIAIAAAAGVFSSMILPKFTTSAQTPQAQVIYIPAPPNTLIPSPGTAK